MFAKFLDGMNFISRCRKYGLGLWQCPNFLFLVMGLITVAAMFGTFFASERFADEGVTIMSVTLVVAFIMTLGSFVISGVEKVAEANILKTEFISIISHQLCSPLSAIKWNMEILETEKEPDTRLSEKKNTFLSNIKKSNEQMLKMVTDLLEVARVDQGKAIFEKKNLKLADLVKETVIDFQGIAAEKNVKIESQIEADSEEVCADEKKMGIVLDNLIGNATQLAKTTLRVTVFPLLGIREMRRRAVGIHDEHKSLGIGVPMQFSEDRTQNIPNGRPTTMA